MEEIAALRNGFDCSVGVVVLPGHRAWLKISGVELRPWGVPQTEYEQVKKLHGQGWTQTKIGEHYGCSRTTIGNVLAVPGHQVGSSRLIGGLPPSALWRHSVL